MTSTTPAQVPSRSPFFVARLVGTWILMGLATGVLCGLSSSLFLWLLDLATKYRGAHTWLVWLLPVAGGVLGLVLALWGTGVVGGNNLVLDTIHVDSSDRLPRRMAPLMLFGSVWTHLFGGSAGREGTAVQMGAALSDVLAKAVKARGAARVQMLSAGIAGGFGAVFGTPIAGAVFGVEVVRVGRIEYHALIPALVAALTGDYVTRALGIQHTAYPVVAELALTLPVAGKLLLLAVGCALASILFIDLTHTLKAFGRKHARWPALRLFAGGCAVVALWQLSGTDDYLGLSVPLIVRSFSDPSVSYGAFMWKIVLTAVTLGAGFLGGEVTPLFCIGATLGNLLGRALGLPLDLAAACGFAAVFGAAANTPLACAIMAVELFGSHVLPHAALVCIFAYLLTGHRGIYPSQRILVTKHGEPIAVEKKLGEL